MSIVVITGAAGALGSAVARRLSSAGHALVLVDLSPERTAALADGLGRARPVVAPGGVTPWEAVHAAAAELGGVVTGAALVAGGWAGGAPVHAQPDDEGFTRMMGLNAGSVHGALRALLPPMIAAGRGSVVVIGARPVERPWTAAGSAAYAASKAAAVTLAQAAAAEVLSTGVRINAVLPSTLDTPANRASMPEVDPTTWVSLDSLAGVIEFLLSDAARDVSGATIPVYGRA